MRARRRSTPRPLPRRTSGGAPLDDELAALGGDDQRPGPGDRPAAVPGRRDRRRRDRGPRRGRALAAEEALLADADAHRDALAHAYEVLEGPASDALGDAVAALVAARRSPRSPRRLRGLQAELAELAQELRLEVERVDATPSGSRPCARAAHQLLGARPQVRRHPRRRDRRRIASADRLAELERYEDRAASIEGRRAEHDGGRRGRRPRRSPPPAGRRPSRWPGRSRLHLRELAMPRGGRGRGRGRGSRPTTAPTG